MTTDLNELRRLKKLIDPSCGWGPFESESDTKLLIALIDAAIAEQSRQVGDDVVLERLIERYQSKVNWHDRKVQWIRESHDSNRAKELQIVQKEILHKEDQIILAALSAYRRPTADEVQFAIDVLGDWQKENVHDPSVGLYQDEEMAKAIPTAITALQKMKGA